MASSPTEIEVRKSLLFKLARASVERFWAYYFGKAFLAKAREFRAKSEEKANPPLAALEKEDVIESKLADEEWGTVENLVSSIEERELTRRKPSDEEWKKAWDSVNKAAKAKGEPTFEERDAALMQSLEASEDKIEALRVKMLRLAP